MATEAAAWGDGSVLLTKGQALRVVFPRCERTLEVRRMLEHGEKRRLERALHRTLEERGFLVYLGLRAGELDGFAVITNEIGKTEPITFIVGANRDGSVRRAAVMVYRESHGGEVQARRFLSQFEGKSTRDPIELHRDVINVSGATLSAAALCNGTRKSLEVLEELFLHRPPDEIVREARAAGAREFELVQPQAESSCSPDAADRIGPAVPALRRQRAGDPDPQHAPISFLASIEARRLVMGSELSVVALSDAPGAFDVVQSALDAAERLDEVLSDWREDSELSSVNRAAGLAPVKVSEPMLDFLEQSSRLWRETQGAFDPAIGELVRAWGFRGGPPRRPDLGELADVLAKSGFAGVAVDPAASTVAFTRARVRLDPGAIGKGMAVDAVAAALRRAGIDNALVDFGSTHVALGGGPDGLGWPVGVRAPDDPEGILEVLYLRDRACSTSGGYQKFVELDGERFSHVLDPRTGRPARGCLSATALASTGARSDALSTALFVLGPGDGAGMIEPIADAAGLVAWQEGGAIALTKTSRWPGSPRAPLR
jgi:thiamine biosynthesis lipoprotein